MTHYVHVVAQYHPVIGGAQQYCATLSEALIDGGHDVSVYTSRLSDRGRWENDLPRLEAINGVRVQRFSALKRGRLTWRIFHWCRNRYSHQQRLVYELGLMLAEGPISTSLPAALVARRKEYLLVHLFGVYSGLIWEAFAAARIAGSPIVITPFIHTTPPIGLDLMWKRRVLSKADHVVAMTKSESAYLQCELGLDPNRVSVVSPSLGVKDYPMIDPGEARYRLGLPSESFVVLFIGRKEPHKGILTLLEAFRELCATVARSSCLILIGPEIAQSNMPSLKAWLDGNVIDLGEVGHDAKLLALNACDCLTFPSASESFGIVILEAWAVAKPVIVSSLPSIQDTVTHDIDGLLFDVGSVPQLTEALKRLAEDPEKATAMGKNGQQKFLTSYTTATMAEKLQRIYDSVGVEG